MKILSLCVTALLFILAAVRANAQQDASDEQRIELFEAPVVIERAMPSYPATAARRGAEGWVEFGFMVSPQGRPYEVHVVDSAGDESFIGAAERALERTVFSPARFEGRTVDASSRMKITFELEGGGAGKGARRSFTSRFRRFMSTLVDGSRAEAAEALGELEAEDILNSYEDAYLNLARYSFALQYAAPGEQIAFLRSALGESLASPESKSHLEGEAAREARRSLLQLQLVNSHFAEAAETFELMRRAGDDEGIEMFGSAIAQTIALKSSDTAYSVVGQIQDSGSWLITLFRDSFRITDVVGTVKELKLRCERSYVFFVFDPDLQYDVSSTAGECSLEVIGDPGTGFSLVQGPR